MEKSLTLGIPTCRNGFVNVTPLREAPPFHTICPVCGVTVKSDLLASHMTWVHKQGVKCLTCMDRGVVPDLWNGGDDVCPHGCGTEVI